MCAVCPAFDYVVQQVQHLPRSLPAQHAFAAGLVLRKLHEEARNSDHAGPGVHDHKAAGAYHGAGEFKVVEIKGQVEILSR